MLNILLSRINLLFLYTEYRLALTFVLLGGSFSGVGCRAQSAFNTIGYRYQKPVVPQSAEEDDDEDDETTDEGNVMELSADSLRECFPMVAYPLKSIKVTSPFGMRRDPMNKKCRRMHSGIDLKAKYEDVYSMLPGTVTAAAYSQSGGYYITVNHGSCVCSYLHLSKIAVKVGQHVNAGQAIAISGNTGKRTTGPHLHISCRWGDEKGKYFNPMLILGFVYKQLSNK